jgi:DNA-binding NarL/FixJ family response regulator
MSMARHHTSLPALRLPAVRSREGIARLTQREREILGLMAEGWANGAISEQLFLSPKTLETHISNIFTKLGVGTEAHGHRRVLAVLCYVATATVA